MSKLTKFAENELKIHKSLIDKNDKSIILPYREEILSIIKKFDKQGYDEQGTIFAAKVIGTAIRNLLMEEIISPIIGDDNEWVLVTHTLYQNNRCSNVFKESKDAQPHYLDAIHWRLSDGRLYAGKALDSNNNIIQSKQYINLPFSPHTFIIDVTSKDENNIESDFYIKDQTQLDEVFKYYNRYEVSEQIVQQ